MRRYLGAPLVALLATSSAWADGGIGEVLQIMDGAKLEIKNAENPAANYCPNCPQPPNDVPKLSCADSKSPLFQSEVPLEITMKGAFPARGSYSDKQEDPKSLPIDPATIIYQDGNKVVAIPVGITARGKSRNFDCPFKPILITWPKPGENGSGARAGTLFDKLNGEDLKLTVHCYYVEGGIDDSPAHKKANDDVLKEYSTYKLLQAAGFPSLDVRLAKIQYEDPTGKPTVQGMGFFLEPRASIAKRCGLNHLKDNQVRDAVRDMDPRAQIPGLLSRLLVNASDFIVKTGQNSIALADANGKIQGVIPYDFNDSALVQSRGFKIAFEDPEVIFTQLRKGPFTINGDGPVLHGDALTKWTAALLAESQRVLSRKADVMAAIDRMPLQAEGKQAFKAQAEMFFKNVKQLVDTGAKPTQ